MSAIPPDLAGLRRRLDAIDDRLHDLLIERAEIVAMVAAQKRDGRLAFYQPGREAEIIRRLAARRPGRFPLVTLVRMWREMLAATVRQQTPFAVAVFAPGDAPGLWDLARDHYGSATPMSVHAAASDVIRAVGAGEAAVGVLPMPAADDPDPWWRRLLSQDAKAPRVIARLPFGPRGNARNGGGDALVVGFATAQPTGADRTLFAIAAAPGIGRARILGALAATRPAATLLAAREEAEGTLALIEIDGFVPAQDPRLDGLAALCGESLRCLWPLGGYALPLPAHADAAKG
ncbi:MAG TPA: chorismate mutase [Stellaceae bacterium]|nr:chorismate mutase [Stellaceae bacterium]